MSCVSSNSWVGVDETSIGALDEVLSDVLDDQEEVANNFKRKQSVIAVDINNENEHMHQDKAMRRSSCSSSSSSSSIGNPGHIQVVCRVRPRSKKEIKLEAKDKSVLRVNPLANTVTIARPNASEEREFQFDFCANASTTQEEIFHKVGLSITKRCMEGFNGTILCYGQTGTGKTYTMFGPVLTRRSFETHQGIVPRVLSYLWDQCHCCEEATGDENQEESKLLSASFTCSFYEIYQEKIFDLLLESTASVSTKSLSVREDAKLGVFVEGCTEKTIRSMEEAHDILALGCRNRHTGDTAMNRESSRSHAVFQINIAVEKALDASGGGEDGPHSVTSRFSMVDLAGSERQRDTEAFGGRLKEANNINKSLTALGKVINELSDASGADHSTPRKKRHVSYRDSKLTFLLKDSLGGTAKTVLLATVSGSDDNYVESLSTLQFALRARGVCNVLTRQPEEATNAVVSLQAEVKQLKAKLARYSNAHSAHSSPMQSLHKRSSLLLSPNAPSGQSFTPKKRRESLKPLSQAQKCAQGSPMMKKLTPLEKNGNAENVDKENEGNSPVHKHPSKISPPASVLQPKKSETAAEVSEWKRKYRELEDELQRKDQELEQSAMRVQCLSEAQEKLEYELAVAHEQSEGRFTHTKVLLSEMEVSSAKNKNYEVEVQALIRSRDAIVQELEAMTEQNDCLSQELSSSRAKSKTLQEENERLEQQLNEANASLKAMQEKLSEARQSESFRTFADIRGQSVESVLAEKGSRQVLLRDKSRQMSFSDSETDSCDSITEVQSHRKAGTANNRRSTLSSVGMKRKKADMAGEEDDEWEESVVSEEGMMDTAALLRDYKEYARDKIANFSDSESDSASSDTEVQSRSDSVTVVQDKSVTVNNPTCTVANPTCATVSPPKCNRSPSPMNVRGDIDVIRSHGFYGSPRSPLRAPNKASTPSSSKPSGIFHSLGKFFGISSSSKHQHQLLPLASPYLTTAPPVPNNLKCEYIHDSWKDGHAVLTWNVNLEDPPSLSLDSSSNAISSAKLAFSSPKKKQRKCSSIISFEVQRSVVPFGRAGCQEGRDGVLQLPEFETIGTTEETVFPVQLSTCPLGAAVYHRVRAIFSDTRSRSLWSPACCIETPHESFCQTVVHHLPYPDETFGSRGVLDCIATNSCDGVYQNPTGYGVHAEISCKWFDADLSLYVERYPTAAQLTMDERCRPCSHLIIDLGPNRRLQPDGYALRGFLNRKTILKSWQLEASNDKSAAEWVLLRRHHNDTSAISYDKQRQYATGSWSIDSPHQVRAYRYFRVYQLDPSSQLLECSGVELYGKLTVLAEKEFCGELKGGVYIPE